MIISLQWKFDQSWCCILLSSGMLGFFVTTISSAKCDVFVLIFQTKIVPRNVVHVSCCFLHTLVYITFTSLFSIVCAKTEQFNGFQRYPLNWWFWYDKYLIRSHLRASTCALRLSAWQSTWTLLHCQCCQKLWGCLVTLFPYWKFWWKGIAWSRKVGELTIFLFPKLSEARAHFKH